MLEVQGLIKIYRRRRVVDGVTLHVDQGEIVGLLGPNGAGKTTTFRMALGLIDPDGGEVYLDGKRITRLPMYKRARLGISFLPQEPSVFRGLTVRENILAILQTQKIPRRERQRRLDELLSELELTRLADSKAYNLSGGERRRLEITRALVIQPKYILLDEPFAAIDPIVRADIQNILGRLKARGIGILLTDHNVRETLQVSERSYIINEGRILVHGRGEEIVADREARRVYLGDTFAMPEIQVRHEDRTRAVSSHETGLSQLRAGHHEAARTALSRAAEATPDDPAIRRALAKACLLLGENDAALAESRLAVALDPSQALSYVFRGFALYATGDDAGARADLDRARALDPTLACGLPLDGAPLPDGSRPALAPAEIPDPAPVPGSP